MTRYCGRFVGEGGYLNGCGSCDGRCGPTNGCQCLSCARVPGWRDASAACRTSGGDFAAQFEATVAQLGRLFSPAFADGVAPPWRVRHDWDDKFLLAEQAGNMFVAAALQALRLAGLTPALIDRAATWARRDRRAVTLSFSAEQRCAFVGESQRTVAHETEQSVLGLFSVAATKVHRSAQYQWSYSSAYRLCLHTDDTVQLRANTTTATFTTSTRQPPPLPELAVSPAIVVDVTPLFALLAPVALAHDLPSTPLYDPAFHTDLPSTPLYDPAFYRTDLPSTPFYDPAFRIDRSAATCRTPRRNADTAALLAAAEALRSAAADVVHYFFRGAGTFAAPAPPPLADYHRLAEQLFVPVVPLLASVRTGVLFPPPSNATPDAAPDVDVDRCFPHFLAEQQRCLHELHAQLADCPPGASALFTAAEAQLCLTLLHVADVAARYADTSDWIEAQLADQLVAALGGPLLDRHFADYMRSHWRRRLRAAHRPRPFAYPVRVTATSSKDGVVSIEQSDHQTDPGSQTIATFVRHVPAGRAHPMRLTINAGCQLTFTGERYVHSWLRTDFAAAPPAVELTARCSNFGAYVLLLGSIPAADQFSATHAFLLRGRCLLRIALLVERLPSPGEFRDAVASLSPQQQAFAKAYRAMQLNATLFAVCVVQVKPQLERLLRLPPGALAKQLALTDDVIDLLTDWHFPPDLLSLDAAAPPLPAAAAVQTVRRNADRLLAIVAAEKQRLVDEQQRRRREENEALRLREQEEEDRRRTEAMPLQPLVDDATLENLKAMFEDISRLVQDQSCAIENIEANDDSTVLHESMHGRRGLFQLFRKLGSTPVAPTSEAVAAQVLHDLQSSRAQLVQTRSLIDEPALDGVAARSFVNAPLLPESIVNDPMCSTEIDPMCSIVNDPMCSIVNDPMYSTMIDPMYSTVNDPVLVADSPPTGEQSSSFEDYTLLPSELDQRFVDESGAVRAMTIKPDDDKAWTLSRHPALTAEARTDTVDDEGKKQARNVAMDLLEAMTRSGELTASDATLHIVLGQSHAFADTLMHTLVRDNVNPIDCVERSSLIAAATVLRCRSQ